MRLANLDKRPILQPNSTCESNANIRLCDTLTNKLSVVIEKCLSEFINLKKYQKSIGFRHNLIWIFVHHFLDFLRSIDTKNTYTDQRRH